MQGNIDPILYNLCKAAETHPMIIGLDVGGTHADVVLIGRQGLVKQAKVPTDETQLFETVLSGLEAVTEGVDLTKIRRIVLSTTLAANIVVQRKLPPVGMIVAGGPGLDPLLFRPNEDYHVVKGALDHRGREIAPLDKSEIQAVAASLAAQGHPLHRRRDQIFRTQPRT
jgi:N-methylhydantoinase A